MPTFVLIATGVVFVLAFLLAGTLRGRLFTLPMLYVILGFLAFQLPIDLPYFTPEDNASDRLWLEYLTEIIVIISVAAIGLTLDRRPSWKNWSSGVLLVAVAMPLCIAAVAGLGWGLLGLAPASAILLGSVLAPTDPVLAESVQVGPPNDGEKEDPVRFSLSLEAGLNDGLAFPFVYLAIGLLGAATVADALLHWAWMDVGVRLGVGIVMGLACGYAASWAFFSRVSSISDRGPHVREGIFVLGGVLLTYGVTEAVHGYGFLAVFIAAVVARHRDADHPLHEDTHAALEQMETAMMGLFLVGFGGALATGALDDLTWSGVAIGLALLLVIRPLTAWAATYNCTMGRRHRAAVSLFGIRGLGSLYYLSYAHNQYEFDGIDTVWSTVSFTILCSIVLHGAATTPVLRWADRDGA